MGAYLGQQLRSQAPLRWHPSPLLARCRGPRAQSRKPDSTLRAGSRDRGATSWFRAHAERKSDGQVRQRASNRCEEGGRRCQPRPADVRLTPFDRDGDPGRVMRRPSHERARQLLSEQYRTNAMFVGSPWRACCQVLIGPLACGAPGAGVLARLVAAISPSGARVRPSE